MFFYRALAIFLLGAAAGQAATRFDVSSQYSKREVYIPMRDGKRLFTIVYAPIDAAQKYPILLTRTPYGVAPYGTNAYPETIGPTSEFDQDGFIYAFQDVRGRFRSEGDWVEMRPLCNRMPDSKAQRTRMRAPRRGTETAALRGVPLTPRLFCAGSLKASTGRDPAPPDERGTSPDLGAGAGPPLETVVLRDSLRAADESTDAYDTVDWLIRNVPGNNGRVGLVGISYPGTYAAMGMINAHPAVKAVSPQAPVADLYRNDDAYHNGAFMLLANYNFYAHFEYQSKPGIWVRPQMPDMHDAYHALLRVFPVRDLLKPDSSWRDTVVHTAYDDFWQSRSLLPHLRAIKPAVLVAGGWFDAEDLSGSLKTYCAIRQQSPNTIVYLAMGPWKHGGWQDTRGDRLGDLSFGSDTATFFQHQIALPFFRHYLKDAGELALPSAYVFETGSNTWTREDSWPPIGVKARILYLQPGNRLEERVPALGDGFDEYVSDPHHPVPAFEHPTGSVEPSYMDANQRFVEQRPDVVHYRTSALGEDLTVSGPIKVTLAVSSTGTDSDFVVKVVDEYPEGSGTLSGYRQLVRGEPFRAKFRDSFEHPKPLTRRAVERVQFALPDVNHCFRKGHRLMVEIQSSWFPLVDLNPQQFLDIPSAKAKAYQIATERIYHSREAASYVELPVR